MPDNLLVFKCKKIYDIYKKCDIVAIMENKNEQ
jgi:hypothetical protein